MKRFDFIIIAVVVLLSIASLLPLIVKTGDTVLIEQNGVVLYQGPLNHDAIIEAEGNTIVISDGRVTITHANCPDRLCMAGECTRVHPLICLPNKLSVTIISKTEDIDAISF